MQIGWKTGCERSTKLLLVLGVLISGLMVSTIAHADYNSKPVSAEQRATDLTWLHDNQHYEAAGAGWQATASDSTPTGQLTIDPDSSEVQSPATAFTGKPGETKTGTDPSKYRVLGNPVDATVQVAGRNGTENNKLVVSQSEDYRPNGAIINTNTTDLWALFGLRNMTNSAQHFSYTFMVFNLDTEVTATMIKGFEKDLAAYSTAADPLVVKYTTDTGTTVAKDNFVSRDQVTDWSQVKGIQVSGTLQAGEQGNLHFAIPLKMPDGTYSGIQFLRAIPQNHYGSVAPDTDGIPMRVAEQSAGITNYVATVTTKGDHDTVETVPASQLTSATQEEMPKVGKGQISYYNYYDYDEGNSTYTATHLFTNGDWKVNLQAVANSLNTDNYGYALAPPGSGNYALLDHGSIWATTSSQVPNYPIKLIKVLATHNSTAKVGDAWTPKTNFDWGIQKDGQTLLNADDVQTDATDTGKAVTTSYAPSDMVQDGKIVKPGKLTVTYAYKMGNYTDGTPYRVTRTATVTVPNPSQPTGVTSGYTNTNVPVKYRKYIKRSVTSVKKIGLYKKTKFSTASRLRWFNKQPRTRQPHFVVQDVYMNKAGRVRYRVKDVNPGSPYYGKFGYITTWDNYIHPTYYQTRTKTMTVLGPHGVNAYREAGLITKAAHYRQGTFLHVRRIVKSGWTTRLELTNGTYVSANKQLVYSGKLTMPEHVVVRQGLNRYRDYNLKRRVAHYARHKRLRVYGWDYSDHGALRYRVTGGYVSANPKLVTRD